MSQGHVEGVHFTIASGVWISCAGFLPPLDELVLVRTQLGNVHLARRIAMRSDGCEWQGTSGYFVYTPIIHWLRIPK
jgi:hypothetical protein